MAGSRSHEPVKFSEPLLARDVKASVSVQMGVARSEFTLERVRDTSLKAEL